MREHREELDPVLAVSGRRESAGGAGLRRWPESIARPIPSQLTSLISSYRPIFRSTASLAGVDPKLSPLRRDIDQTTGQVRRDSLVPGRCPSPVKLGGSRATRQSVRGANAHQQRHKGAGRLVPTQTRHQMKRPSRRIRRKPQWQRQGASPHPSSVPAATAGGRPVHQAGRAECLASAGKVRTRARRSRAAKPSGPLGSSAASRCCPEPLCRGTYLVRRTGECRSGVPQWHHERGEEWSPSPRPPPRSSASVSC
jgi:hypothetical protein